MCLYDCFDFAFTVSLALSVGWQEGLLFFFMHDIVSKQTLPLRMEEAGGSEDTSK